ncbi:polycomb group RING finger protein 6 [Spea bombifrons]|uniref:polycomb group RING finger protein 6 n=1 Tax=Spea bombifrons TaxID=233779 RepID=UPI00234BDCC9|nr:polycomb group RING finger protein 6 [Spea bombifrons]
MDEEPSYSPRSDEQGEDLVSSTPRNAESLPELTRSSFGEDTGSSIGTDGGEDEGVGEQQLSPEEEEEPLINLTDLNPYIRCSICKGYFIDATTITECLHTFCKSCIVRHFYYSNRCPKCNVVVHQTQPLYNIRLDRQLQDIVYKLVVNLEEREKTQMCEFYRQRGLEVPKPPAPQAVCTERGRSRRILGPVFRIPSELDVSLLLEFMGAAEGTGNFKPLEKKFVRVSGSATIGHVEKFLRRKMQLDPACQVDIICGDHLLEHYQTLREILTAIGESAVQDGLLVLHFCLVLSPLSLT